MHNISILQDQILAIDELTGISVANYKLISKLISKSGIESLKIFFQYKSDVVIYGAGVMGKLLYDNIKEFVTNLYIADRELHTNYEFDFPILLPESLSKNRYDCIIITPLQYEQEIKQTLLSLGNTSIYSLSDILYKNRGETV